MAITFPEDTQLASRYVKQAIPLMIKNGIAPNPCTFTLWYTYVTNRDKELKNALDRMMEEKKEFSEEISRELFRKYVIKDEIDLQGNLQESLTSVLHGLMDSVGEVKNGTDNFQRSLTGGLDNISGEVNQSSLEDTIKLLIETTQSVKDVTDSFQDQLKNAETEIAELRQLLHEEIQHTYLDPLTKIGNRRAFDRRMLELFQQEKETVSLILIDLDHFKTINDTYGHVMGDKVLQGISIAIQNVCSEATLIARYGGEEFAILLEDTQEAAYHTTQAIQVAFSKLILKKKNTGEIVENITASFGLAQKLEGEFPDELIERADKALYTAKENGRNQIQISK